MLDFLWNIYANTSVFDMSCVVVFLIQVILLYKIYHDLSVRKKRQVKEFQDTRLLLITAVSGMILEITVRHIGEIDQIISDHISIILEKFPHTPVVNHEGVWCESYVFLMDHLCDVSRDRKIVSKIIRGNVLLHKAACTRFSSSLFNTDERSIIALSHLGVAVAELSVFCQPNFMSQWWDIACDK